MQNQGVQEWGCQATHSRNHLIVDGYTLMCPQAGPANWLSSQHWSVPHGQLRLRANSVHSVVKQQREYSRAVMFFLRP
jgi:hypothetical protein